MRKTITMAAALLVLQLGLVAALSFRDGGREGVRPDSPFLTVTPDAVTSLEIIGPEKDRIVLQKGADGWILPEFFGAPVRSEQITALLVRIAELKQGFAVAKTTAAANRFKVADDLFQRHVLVKEGDRTVGDFYLGTSPGFRQIHARRAGSEDIIAVELSTFELETGAEQWLDKEMFRQKQEEMQAISFADFTLVKKEDSWQLEGLPEGVSTNASAVADLVAKASGLTIQTIVAPQEGEPLFAKPPALQYSISVKDGRSVVYRLARAGDDMYILKQSESDLYARVHGLQVAPLLKASRESLTAAPVANEVSEADGEAGPKEVAGDR